MFVVPTGLGRPRGALRVVTATAFLGLVVSSRSGLAQQPSASAARPATHTVKRGDTLWDIAKLYLGDPFLWPEIYRINTDLIEDPHWIYPGEVLKLPQESERVVAEAPPTRVTPVEPAPPVVTDTAPPHVVAQDTTPAAPTPPPVPTVRTGEYIASPWVDQRGGPRGSGHLIGNADIQAVSGSGLKRMSLYDPVLVAPPAGAVVGAHTLLLTYRLGPVIDDMGQIVVPTGVIEITRPAQNGEAAIGRVVRLFDEMIQGEQVIPLDSSGALVSTHPVAVANGHEGKVRWIQGAPVLATVQSYVVVDIGRSNVSTGDEILLYRPRQRSYDEGGLATPEVPIAHAQVLRVTPYGAAAVITSQSQPAVEEGVSARVTARMP